MQTKITDIINQVLIPSMDKKMVDQNRLVSVEKSGDGDYLVKYNRDDLSVEIKKELEAAMLTALSGTIEEDEVMFMSVSTQGANMAAKSEAPKDAKPEG